MSTGQTDAVPMTADEFAAAVVEALRSRQRSSLTSAELRGEFPSSELLMRSARFGWRVDLFTDEAGQPLGPWDDIQARLLMYRSASRFATEMWSEFEDRENSETSRESASVPDSNGVRWFAD